MNDKERFVITDMTYQNSEYRVMMLLDAMRNAIEIDVELPNQQSLIGNIYIARVLNIVPSIQAAFLEIASGQTVFYSLEDMEQVIYTKNQNGSDILCQGDEIVVQVTKDAIKSKDPIVTTNLSFESEHVVLTSGKKMVGISRKITGSNRNRLKSFLTEYEMTAGEQSFGLVIRTNATEISKEMLFDEIKQLEEMYQQFLATVIHKTCYTLVHQAKPYYISQAEKYLKEDIQIITDSLEIYQEVLNDCESNEYLMPYKENVLLYEDEYSIDKLYSLSKKLDDAVSSRVWMNSGAYLVIEPTEALTVIDVNSGKNIKNRKKQDVFLQINLEAAEEIAKQLRLRNISGIIVVDFINMEREEDWEQLMSALRQFTKADPIKVQVLDVTKLGLIEMTREKHRQTLQQQINKKC